MSSFKKGLAGLVLGGVLAMQGCLTTGRNYNHNASYFSRENAIQRSHDLNDVTMGVLGTPYASGELNRDEPVPQDNNMRGRPVLSYPNNNPAANTSVARYFGSYGSAYAYNYAEDFNHDHVIKSPEELVGVKDAFYEGERMNINFFMGKNYNRLCYKLIDGTGAVIESFEEVGPKGMLIVWHNPTQSEVDLWKSNGSSKSYPHKYLGSLKPGSYKGLVYCGEELLSMKDFTIVPRNNSLTLSK